MQDIFLVLKRDGTGYGFPEQTRKTIAGEPKIDSALRQIVV